MKKNLRFIAIVGLMSFLFISNVITIPALAQTEPAKGSVMNDGTGSPEKGSVMNSPSTGQTTGDTSGGLKIKNPLGDKVNTLPDLLILIIDKIVLPIGGIIVAFMIIYTGFKFVMAQGDPGELTKAKQSLMNTLIGAAIILGALSISIIIKSIVDDIIKVI